MSMYLRSHLLALATTFQMDLSHLLSNKNQFSKLVFSPFAFIVLLSFVLVFTSSCKDNRMVNGAKAPDIILPDPSGKEISLYEIAKDQIVIVDFWASWCKPCIETHETLKEVYAKWKDKPSGNAKGLTIFSVSLDDKPENWKAALEKHNIPWPHQVNDPKAFGSPYVDSYQFDQVPTVFVLDERGLVIGRDITLKWLEYELKRRN